MSQKNFALSKKNMLICAIAMLMIIAGFLLMTGNPTSLEGGFEPNIFSARRIKFGPIVALSGFALMIVGILYSSNENSKK